MKRSRWTNWELDVVRRDYRRLGVDKMALLLNCHSREAIKQKARALGLAKPGKCYDEKTVAIMRVLRFEGRLKCRELSRGFGGNTHTVNRATNGVTYQRVPMPWDQAA
jgi:hypothetical protein